MTSDHVAVGVDGSPTSRAAVRWAAQEAVLRGCPLTLVAAHPEPPEFIPDATFLLDDLRRGAEDALRESERLAASVRGMASDAVRTRLVPGPPVTVLVEVSRRAELLVLGMRGLGELSGGMLGSTSSAVVGPARCPVAVVPMPGAEDAGATRPVVVGVDGSGAESDVLAAAFEEAQLRGAELVAVHAWTDLSVATAFRAPETGPPLDEAALRTAERAALAESLAGWGERHPDVRVRPVVVRDRPVRHLLDAARGAALLVVGSRGRGGFPSLLMGSTSRALLHTAPCPLLVVRTTHDNGSAA